MTDNIAEGVPSFQSEKYVWLRAHCSLDLMEMDEAVMQMGVLIQEAGEYCALANERRESAKDELEQVKAQVAEYLRGQEYKGKQRSESMIESQLPTYPDCVNSQLKLSAARRDAALWASVVEALRAKSMQIRVAADLINSGFLTQDHIISRRRKQVREAMPKPEQVIS